MNPSEDVRTESLQEVPKIATCVITALQLSEIDALVQQRLVSRRKHPTLPLFIYNYTAAAQGLGPTQWSDTLQLCRGLILDDQGSVVGRPFRKFWNYESVKSTLPLEESFTVWEKVDGSLGIVCQYQEQLVVATRGSFESDQARWAARWLQQNFPAFLPDQETFLFEVVYPQNRIVVDYGEREGLILLAVLNQDGTDNDEVFNASPFVKAKRFDGITDFSVINQMAELDGQEGLVVRWQSGFRAKLKRDDYLRLHRLLTQCSNRTIWELLKTGQGTAEVFDRVPADFQDWAAEQVKILISRHREVKEVAERLFTQAPQNVSRKEFAEYAKQQPYPGLLFTLLDGKPIEEQVWKLIEPKWAAPFRCSEE